MNFVLRALARSNSPSATNSAMKSERFFTTSLSWKSQSISESTTLTYKAKIKVLKFCFGIFLFNVKLTKSENALRADLSWMGSLLLLNLLNLYSSFHKSE